MFKHALYTMFGIAVLAAGLWSAVALAGDHPDHKTTICHVPPGNPENAHTITIDDNALQAHLGDNNQGLHGGDYYGECEGEPPTTTTEPPTTTTEPPTTTTTPHVVTGAASVICDNRVYVLRGTVDGQAADSVSPATLPGNTKGTIEVVVTRGDTSVRTTVAVNGDCAPTTTTTSPTPAATPPPSVASTLPPPSAAAPPETSPAARKPAVKKQPVRVVKVVKKKNSIVKITTSDGETHVGVMGSG